jgi:hypothetical protein
MNGLYIANESAEIFQLCLSWSKLRMECGSQPNGIR